MVNNEKEWLTQKEIADMLNVPLSKLYQRISGLRRAGVIDTKQNPSDDRIILINVKSLDIIKRAMGIV